ncbi:hypothetical protein D1816_13110 [Aquimarina sp. AD10]|uniref:Peptidase M10 metallopeptidase domain-containing protein n=1 Tax=Aquimarina aggregata TaxID=1642818 RepID=A0A162YT81_9FLAO|nr:MULTISPECIES: hypothetical protein [Aquimarina]AXT61244.1 hypothetical protein D1816_13110 [Aquimarina sp. AD10]KZS39340.1 hypothetical protein AWE51_12420 [Aquimarina aggregata]RKN02139.1 hypothetical protein D7033_01495 [Aquimarina sp. AD10]
MKKLLFIATIFLSLSCSNGDDFEPVYMDKIFVENPERTVKVNIIYVENEGDAKRSYNFNEQEFMNYLNGYYFHRLGIGLELNESKVLANEELYDLRDNVGSEASTFFMQSQDSYEKGKLNIYIIKRSNIIGVAGMGRNQRVLLTDTNIFNSTSPHEIGHALGLFHDDEITNIMSTTLNKDLRQSFNEEQEKRIEKRIDQINLGM